MISYAAMFTKDTTLYDLNKNLSTNLSLKQNFTVLYDIIAINDFPNISNIQKKLNQKPSTRASEAMENTIDISTSAPNHNEDTISTLLVENNKTEQVNITKIIFDNNKSNKITFLQILQDNNNKIKIDIMETLKTTMDEKKIPTQQN